MKIAFLFSGQGAQFPGMMKDVAENIPAAQAVFDMADNELGRCISVLCFNGSQEDLNLTHNTQPCVLAADLAAYMALSEEGIKPDAVAGFSLGEYAALVAAGVISMKDAFPVIQQRADFMQDAVPVGNGAMAAVMKLTEEEVNMLCSTVDGYVIPANFNCPGQIVVSGETKAVDALCTLAKERKIRTVKLPVSAPFHCEMLNSAAKKLAETLRNIVFAAPQVSVYMNVDGREEEENETIREKLILQAKSPVRWEDTLRNMKNAGVDTFIEIGPGKTLTGFVKKTLGEDVKIFNVGDMETLAFVVGSIKAYENSAQ